eukprot:5207431-Prymnesium_polylepis.1
MGRPYWRAQLGRRPPPTPRPLPSMQDGIFPGRGGVHALVATAAPAFGAATRPCMPGDSAP